jgi:hypothetical protein
VLDAPPTSTSRVEGLSRLGSVGGTTIFNGASFVLSTKIPYVASPESWVTALIDYFNPLVGMQWTSPPSPQNPRNLICYFSQLPAERSLLTISLEAIASDTGATCRWGGSRTWPEGCPQTTTRSATRSRAPTPTTRWTSPSSGGGMAPPDFVMTLEPGIEWMLFNSVALQTAPLVVFPGVF